jgi:MarR family transcriptional regulator, lower aerobic nicotinate degradation pathway regulator
MGTNVSATHGDVRSVLDAVRRIVHALRESSRWAERHVGLSGAQLFVLQALSESSAMTINALAARTHTHQSSVSMVVTGLVERGLVTRTRSAADRRSVEVSLTSRGRRRSDRAPDVAQQRLIAAIERFSPSRRRQLAAALGELAQSVADTSRVPAMFFEEGRRRPAPTRHV